MKRVAKVMALVAWYGLMGEMGLMALVDQGAVKWYAVGACLFMVGVDTLVRSRPAMSRYVDRKLGNAYAMSLHEYTPPPVRYGDAWLPAPRPAEMRLPRRGASWDEDAVTAEIPAVRADRVCGDMR